VLCGKSGTERVENDDKKNSEPAQQIYKIIS
jgi:hypothetical protein